MKFDNGNAHRLHNHNGGTMNTKQRERERERELWNANTREQLERPRTESSERRNVHTVNASEQHRRGLKRIDKLQREILRREIDYRNWKNRTV